MKILKAFFAIFVLAIFAISIVPVSLADDTAITADSGATATPDGTSVIVSNNGKTIKDIIKEKRGTPEFQARVQKAKEVLQALPEQRAEKIKQMSVEDFREFQKKQLMVAVEKCKENPNINQSKCQEKLEKRVALIDKLTQKDAERLKKLEERKAEAVKNVEALKKNVAFAKYKIGKEIKARAIAKDKLQEKKEQYQKAEDKFKELKEQEKERAQKLIVAKQKLKEACKDNQNSTECSAAKQELVAEAKEVLLKQAGLMLESIEKIRAKVEASEDLSSEEEQKIIAVLDTTKAMIENARKKAESATTNQELIDAAKALKSAWQDAKPNLKLESTKVVNARIGGIVVQSKQLKVKLERVMAKMQEKGADTTKVQPLVDKFNVNIESATSNYKQAVDAYMGTNQESAANSAQTYLNNAHKALQDARTVLVDITKELRAQKSADLLSDESEEAEQAAETTTATAEEVAAADAAQVSVEATATETTGTAADTTAASS